MTDAKPAGWPGPSHMINIWIITTIHPQPGKPLRASSIQNLRTANALAEMDCPTLVWMACEGNPCRKDIETRLGMEFSPHLQFMQYRPRGEKENKKTPFHGLIRGSSNLVRAKMGPVQSPDVILTRSPLVLEQLSRMRLFVRGSVKILEWQYPEYMQLWRGWSRQRPQGLIIDSKRFLREQRRLEFRRLQFADGILCAAEDHQRLLVEAGYKGPSRPFPSACPGVVNPENSVPKTHDFGYVGTLSPENGIDTIIHSLSQVPQGRLLLIGSGSREYTGMMKELTRSLRLEDRVELKEWVEPHMIQNIMSTCRIGLVPLSRCCGPEKRQFASPLKLIEWMASGVPVIASRVPSITNRIGSTDAACLIEPDNPDDLAGAMSRLLADSTAWNGLRDRGILFARQSTFRHRASRLTDFVESLDSVSPVHSS
jgi:glycosyltransferase involved in cell wall biosynthesis